MGQSLSKVYLHIVWSTKHRYPFLTDRTIRQEMHAYLGGVCRNLGCPAPIVGGVEDHVHILCRLSRQISIADLVKELKIQSSKWVKTKGSQLRGFRWQNGYGVFSVSERDVDRVVRYVENQEAHHRKKVFKEEFREVLARNNVAYDERYVWD